MPDNEQAEVLEQDGLEETTEAEASAKAQEAGDAEAADANGNDADSQERHKRPGGWQRKIAKLERQRDELIQALTARGGTVADSGKQQADQVADDKPPEKPVRPKISDFEDFSKYDAAMSKYEEDKDSYQDRILAHKLKEERKADAQRAQQQQNVKGWEAKISEAKKVHADFEEVAFSEDTPVSPAMADAITDSELGTEILYFLGKNQSEAERIAKLSPLAAIREIGKIESRIATENKAEADEAEEPPAAASKAPRPPQPVRRPSATNTDPEDKDDYKTWLRKREAQLKARNG